MLVLDTFTGAQHRLCQRCSIRYKKWHGGHPWWNGILLATTWHDLKWAFQRQRLWAVRTMDGWRQPKNLSGCTCLYITWNSPASAEDQAEALETYSVGHQGRGKMMCRCLEGDGQHIAVCTHGIVPMPSGSRIDNMRTFRHHVDFALVLPSSCTLFPSGSLGYQV